MASRYSWQAIIKLEPKCRVSVEADVKLSFFPHVEFLFFDKSIWLVDDQGELGVVKLEDWQADVRTCTVRDENVCCICGCENNEDFDCLVPCPCGNSDMVVHPGCATICKDGGTLKFPSKQPMLPCSICSEQGLVTNVGAGVIHSKSENKSTDKRPTKPMQSIREVTRTGCITTNGDAEKSQEESESPKQQDVHLVGRRFNDAAVTVPIKKRRIQMVEVLRSPSPPRSPSPTKVVQSLLLLSGSILPVPEHVVASPSLVVHDHVGSVPCSDNFREIISSGEPSEDHTNAQILQSDLGFSATAEDATPGSGDQGDNFLVDQLHKEETVQASELGLAVGRSLHQGVTESNDFNTDTAEVSRKLVSPVKEADDRGIMLLRSTFEEPHKVELPGNDMDNDEASVMRSTTTGKVEQEAEVPVNDTDHIGTAPLCLNPGSTRDERLHWDLNMEMEAWEQASSEKPCTDNLPCIKDNHSESEDSSFHQTLSGKSNANVENTLEEAISKGDVGEYVGGHSGAHFVEGDDIEAACVAESFEYDAYDEEDELILDSEKHFVECAEEEQGENRQHMNSNGLVEDVGEELEAEEHVDYSDSDCREADDMVLEGDEKLSLALQAESDWKTEDITGYVEPHAIDKHVTLDGETILEREENSFDFGTRRESHGATSCEMKEEDGELLSQSDGSKLQDQHDNIADPKRGQESAGGDGGEEQESKGEKVMQISESNLGGKGTSGRSELLQEVGNQLAAMSESTFQKHSVPGRTKSTGWDQLPEGFDSVEDALKAVKESSTCQRGATTWSGSKHQGSFISAHGSSRHGSAAVRGISSRVVGNLGDRGRPYDSIRGREKHSHHGRLEDGFDTGSKVTSRETTRGRNFGRGLSAGRVRVEPWTDAPGSQWGSGRRCSPGHYTESMGPSSRAPTNAAALAAAKVQSSGFIVAPDGTIIKAGSATSAGRGSMYKSGVGWGRGIGRGPSIDGDPGINFRTRMSMSSHRSAGLMSKLTRHTPSPPPPKWSNDRREEERSRDRDCKRLVSRVHTPSRRTSPHVVHGSALMDERDRQVLAVTRQTSPTRLKQSEQIGDHPLDFLGRSIDGNSDARRFKRDHDDIGRISGSYHSSSPKAGGDRDRDLRPASSSRGERSREEERRREKFRSRDGRHITGFKHVSTRDVDDDVAPRRRRAS